MTGWLTRLAAPFRRGNDAEFRRLAESSPQSILVHDGQRRLFANGAYARLFGYADATAALAASESGQHVFPEDLPALQARWVEILGGDPRWSRHRHRRRRLDGTELWVDLTLSPIRWNGRPAIHATHIDATREVEAEIALQRSESRFRHLAAESLQGIVVHDGQRRLFVNEAYARIMGYRDAAEALADEEILSHVPERGRDKAMAEWQRLLTGEPEWMHRRLERRRRDGSPVTIEVMRGPILWSGRPAIQSLVIDVTREVQAEAELRRSEAQLRAVLDHLPMMVSLKDTALRYLTINHGFERGFGVRAAEMAGLTTEQALPLMERPMTNPSARTEEQRVLTTGESGSYEMRRTDETGSRDYLMTKFPVRDGDGAIIGVGTIATDVTPLKHAQAQIAARETALRRNQAAVLELLRSKREAGPLDERIGHILEVAGETLGTDTVGIWQLDPAADLYRCVARWRFPDLPPGVSMFPDVLPLDSAPGFTAALEDRFVIACDAGRADWVMPRTRPDDGRAIDTRAVLAAIIRQPEGALGTLTFGSIDAARIWSLEDESFARSVAELIGITLFQDNNRRREDQLRRNQAALVQAARQGILSGRSPREAIDGIARIACETLGLKRVAVWSCEGIDADHVCASLWDAHLGRHLQPGDEAVLSLAERRSWYHADHLPALQEQMVYAIEDVAVDPRLTDVGRARLRDAGVGARLQAVIGLPDRIGGTVVFHAGPGPRRWSVEDVAFARSVADLVAFALLSERHSQALSALDLVDQGLYVENPAGEVIFANRAVRRLAGLPDGAPVAGDALRALAAPARPDAAGAVERPWTGPAGEALTLAIVRKALPGLGAVTLVADVTERHQREAERRALEAEMRQASKLEAIGRLAGGIAHDFNNLIGTIQGFAVFLQEDLPPETEQHGYAERIARASEHATEVVKQLLAFTRAADAERRQLDLRDLVAERARLLRATLPGTTRLVVETGDVPLPLLANEGQLNQVLLNLCLNANDSLEGRTGTVQIALTRLAPGTRPSLPAVAGQATIIDGQLAADCAHACLTVTDDGSGMDAATLGRMIEPFFTTKTPRRGTGLGLAVVHGAVRAHGGAIEVASQPGGGTVVAVCLPLAGPGAAPAAPHETPAESPARGERILVVDDERDLLEMMRSGLERLGFAVTVEEDPVRALDAFRRNPHAWDAVVTDQVMPGLRGCDLIRALREIRPDCPTILCTGFSDGAIEDEALAAGAGGFFFKPVTPRQIAACVRRLLDAGVAAEAHP